MGKYDSSEYRVRPVFNALRAADPSGRKWLARLLELPSRRGRSGRRVTSDALGDLVRGAWTAGAPVPLGWEAREASLPAPRDLLMHLVQSRPSPDPPGAWGDGEVGEKRRQLHDGDVETQRQAVALLMDSRNAQAGRRRWEVLEGPTRPDVYLETPTAIIVIEGKFTEAVPTTKTKWMRTRSQMLRHIDAAWDLRAGRQVYGFFIVESASAPGWMDACEKTVAREMVNGSLPHRIAEDRVAIVDAFLGITTWRDVCHTLDLGALELLTREQIDALPKSKDRAGGAPR